MSKGNTVVVAVAILGAIWWFGSGAEKRKTSVDGAAVTLANQQRFEFPNDQKQFLAIVQQQHLRFDEAANEMLKANERRTRKRLLCASISSNVRSWIGKVYSIGSGGDGDGVLTIGLGEDVWVKTWNNSFSDFQNHTLIKAGTNLFDTVSALKPGDFVRFDGNLFDSNQDCFHEASMTDHGAMTSPEFIMRFSKVEALQ